MSESWDDYIPEPIEKFHSEAISLIKLTDFNHSNCCEFAKGYALSELDNKSEIQKLQAALNEADLLMESVVGMCSNPDKVDACHLILKRTVKTRNNISDIMNEIKNENR